MSMLLWFHKPQNVDWTTINSVLYDNPSGSASTLTVSDNFSNYKYVELFYFGEENIYASQKIYAPENKKVSLLAFSNKTAAQSGSVRISFSLVRLKGNSVLFGDNGVFSIEKDGAIGIGRRDEVYIVRIVGYK